MDALVKRAASDPDKAPGSDAETATITGAVPLPPCAREPRVPGRRDVAAGARGPVAPGHTVRSRPGAPRSTVHG